MSYATKYEKKPGQGSAFANKDKTEDWHADFRGDVLLPDGSLHWLDVTPATTKYGETYYKVKIGNIKGPKAGMSMPNKFNDSTFPVMGQALRLTEVNPDADIPF